MSLSLRDELRVAVCPDQVALLRIERRLSRGGLHRHLRHKDILASDDDGSETLWASPLKTLEKALASHGEHKPVATVTLSNHFVRYALVPWSDQLSDEEEELALARHSFREMYGDEAAQWDLRLSADDNGTHQLASAVESGLLEALRGTFDRAGVGLKSIQPHLMAVYNGCLPQIQGKSGWLALVEPGALCLGLLKEGRFSRLRALRMCGDWREELVTLLDRESYLADDTVRDVFLWAPGHGQSSLDHKGQWRIHTLHTSMGPSFTVSYGGQFTMAMGG